MAQSANNRVAGYSILNPGGAPNGGHAGYGGDKIGTEAMEDSQEHSDPISKQSEAFDDALGSQTSSMKQ